VNFAFRRSVFDRIGGFNTILGSKCEDQELFDRLAAIDACVVYDPAIVVAHQISPERLSKSYYRDWYRGSGRARARLAANGGRSVLGIPFYMLRNGIQTAARFAAAIVSGDRAGAFNDYLMLNLYATYYSSCVTASLRRRPAN
jgi:GT2 family glycosyltransferase